MSWRSSVLMFILVFGVLFSALYLSQLSFKPLRIEANAQIHPKISQLQALEIVLADIKKQHPQVNDLMLDFNFYNFSLADYEQHPEHYTRGHQYSLVNDVRKHPDLLHLRTVYLHPNGTKYYVNPINGTLIKTPKNPGFLWSYCLPDNNDNSNNCDMGIYSLFENRVVYYIDAIPQPANIGLTGSVTWLDADNEQIIGVGSIYGKDAEKLLLPPNVKIYGNNETGEKAITVSELLNPPNSTTIEIVRHISNITQYNNNLFVLDKVIGIIGTTNKAIWKNEDRLAHTVTSDNGYSNPYSGKFDSGILEPGQSYQYAFVDQGIYSYHCKIHPFMKAQIMIVPGIK